jgi:hypothetical protein
MSFIPLNKVPHTKVQYLPSIREAKSHNLLFHNGTVFSRRSVFDLVLHAEGLNVLSALERIKNTPGPPAALTRGGRLSQAMEAPSDGGGAQPGLPVRQAAQLPR